MERHQPSGAAPGARAVRLLGSGLGLGLGLGPGFGLPLTLILKLNLPLTLARRESVCSPPPTVPRPGMHSPARRAPSPCTCAPKSKARRLRPRPAGSPEASFSARSRLRLPRASASLGQSASWAAPAGHIGRVYTYVYLARSSPCIPRRCGWRISRARCARGRARAASTT